MQLSLTIDFETLAGTLKRESDKTKLVSKYLSTVNYGDRTPEQSVFSKEGTLGPGFDRILIGAASQSALRPAGGPILRLPRLESGQNLAQKCFYY